MSKYLEIVDMPTSYSTTLLLARSALLPASAITMFGLACLCNSLTHVFAREKVSYVENK